MRAFASQPCYPPVGGDMLCFFCPFHERAFTIQSADAFGN